MFSLRKSLASSFYFLQITRELEDAATAVHATSRWPTSTPKWPRLGSPMGQARPPNSQPWALGGRVYVVRKEEMEDAFNVVTGNFSIKLIL